MLSVGNGSFIKKNEIEVVAPPESAPLKRLVGDAKDANNCIDLTYGKRTKSIIILKSGRVILSSVTTETLVKNLSK